MDKNQNSRRILYKIAYIFMIIEIVASILIGLIDLSNYFVTKNIIDNSTLLFTYYFKIIFSVICFIKLAWLIPMTIKSKKILNEVGKPEETNHLAFSICQLLFCSLVSGILSIIASSLFETKKTNENNDVNKIENNNTKENKD